MSVCLELRAYSLELRAYSLEKYTNFLSRFNDFLFTSRCYIIAISCKLQINFIFFCQQIPLRYFFRASRFWFRVTCFYIKLNTIEFNFSDGRSERDNRTNGTFAPKIIPPTGACCNSIMDFSKKLATVIS